MTIELIAQLRILAKNILTLCRPSLKNTLKIQIYIKFNSQWDRCSGGSPPKRKIHLVC